jgi:hypothetical protein
MYFSILNLFLLAPQIEIVETTLPESTGEFAPNSQPVMGYPIIFFGIDFDKISVLCKLRTLAERFCSQILAYKRLARKIFWNKELGHCCRRWQGPFGARADFISRAFARTIPVSRRPTLRVKVVRHSGRGKSCGKAGIRKAQVCDAFCKRGVGGAESHGAVTLPPTLREKHAKDGASPVLAAPSENQKPGPPAKERKDGAPSVGMAHAKIVKGGPPAPVRWG